MSSYIWGSGLSNMAFYLQILFSRHIGWLSSPCNISRFNILEIVLVLAFPARPRTLEVCKIPLSLYFTVCPAFRLKSVLCSVICELFCFILLPCGHVCGVYLHEPLLHLRNSVFCVLHIIFSNILSLFKVCVIFSIILCDMLLHVCCIHFSQSEMMYGNAGTSMCGKDQHYPDRWLLALSTQGSPFAYSTLCLQLHISLLYDMFVSSVLYVLFLNTLLLWKPFLTHVKQRCVLLPIHFLLCPLKLGVYKWAKKTTDEDMDILHGILHHEGPVHNSAPVTTITCLHFHYGLSKRLIVSLQKYNFPWAVSSCCLNLYVKFHCHISHFIIVKLSSVAVSARFFVLLLSSFAVRSQPLFSYSSFFPDEVCYFLPLSNTCSSHWTFLLLLFTMFTQ